MKALTLIRPWAWALFHGKPVENRSWAPPTSIIGERIAIHAGKSWDDKGAWFISEQLETYGELPPASRAEGIVGTLVVDRVIGGVRFSIDVVLEPLLLSSWFFGPFGWVTRDLFELKMPILCPGMLGLWTLPPDVEVAVRRQLP